MLGNGHLRVNRIDRLVAVRHIEGHVREVLVDVLEVTSCQAHVRGARIGPVRRLASVEDEVLRHIVQSRFSRCGVTGYSVRLAVVVCCCVLADNRHSRIDRVDRLVAVHYDEGHFAEVRIGIRELVSRQAHVGGAGIRPGRFSRSAEGDVVHIIQFSISLRRIAVHSTGFAVIIAFCAVSGDGHGRFDRGNHGPAVFHSEVDLVEIRVNIAELVFRQTHHVPADIRLRRFRSSVEADRAGGIQVRIRLCFVAYNRMCVAVIRCSAGMSGNRYVRCNRSDRLVAVRHFEGNQVKVFALVPELLSIQAHVARTGVRTICRGFSGEFEVCLAVQRIADLDIIVIHYMAITVISPCIVVSGDGHYHFVHCRDGLITVGYDEVHFEVAVRVRELVRCQAHAGSSGFGPGRFSRAVEGEVSFRIQRVADFDVIAAYAVLFTVVGGRVMVSGNGHRRAVLVDLLPAVIHNEGHLRDIAVQVRELLSIQAHVGGAGVRSGRFGRTVEAEVRFGICPVADLYIIARNAVLLAVVGGSVGMAGNRDRYFNRFDCDVAVCDRECCLKVRVRVGELVFRQTHVGCTDIRSGYYVIAAEVDAGGIVQFTVRIGVESVDILQDPERVDVSAHALFRCVVGEGSVVACDLDVHRLRCNRYLAILHYIKGYVEVRIFVPEQSCVQVHPGVARITAAGFVRSVEGEVVRRVQIIVDLGIIAVRNMELAVIDRFGLVSGDGYRRVRAIDDQLAVHNLEGYGEVVVVVGEVAGAQQHIVGAGVCSAHISVSAECEVIRGVQRVVDVHIVAADRMFFAIVGHSVAVLGDRHGHLTLCDRLAAIRHAEGDFAEVAVRVRELFFSQAHGCRADIRPGRFGRSGEVDTAINVIQLGVSRRDVTAHAVLTAVVSRSVASADDRYLRLDRIDLLPAVRYAEGHSREVRVDVRELPVCQAHVRRAGIRPGRRLAAAVDEVLCHIIQCAAGGCGIAVHAMLGSVIVFRIVRTDNRHSRIDRVDLLIAVRHDEGYRTEVRIDVRELAACQVHVSRSGIGPRRFSRSAEGEVSFRIQRVADLHIVTGHSVLSAVVIPLIIVSDDGDCRVDRIDRLVAVSHFEGDLGEVGVLVLELFFRQAHVCGARNGLRRFSCSGEVEVSFRIQRVADLHIVAADFVLAGVVVNRAGVTGDGHNHFVHRRNRLVAVRYVEGYGLEVPVRVRELLRRQTHERCAVFGPGCLSCSAEVEVSFLVQRVADCQIITADLVLISVVNRRVLMSGNADCHIDRIDLLIAVGHVEGHRAEVRVLVRKLCCCQTHIRRSGVGP